MQLCIVFAVIASLAAAELAPDGDASFVASKFAAVLLVQWIVVLLARVVSLQTQADLACGQLPKNEVNRRLEMRSRWHLGTWVLVSICIVTCFDWPRIVNNSQLVDSTICKSLLILLPILLPLLCSWAVLYRAELALDGSLGKQTCWQYVVAKTRYYVLVPLFPILVVTMWLSACDRYLPGHAGPGWAFVLRASLLPAIAVAFPLMLRILWRTNSLPAGPLRQLLEERCRQFSFSTRDILIWHTDNRMLNAAVAGLLPQMRYVLLTDRLIRDLCSTDVEYVFLHEMAHAKLSHSWKLTMALCGGIATASFSTVTIVKELATDGSEMVGALLLLVFLLSVILVCLLLVGRCARLLELQADLWAATRVGDPMPYLRAIASVSAGHPDQKTWMHPSFERRCQFLLRENETASAWLRSRLRLAWAQLVAWPSCLALLASILWVLR